MANKLINCPVCGAETAASAKACPKCGAKNKKPFYKKWQFYAILAVIVICAAAGGGNSGSSGSKSSASPSGTAETVSESSGVEETVSEPSGAAETAPEVAETAPEPVSYAHYQVTELFDVLSSNAMKAENTYKGQYVEIEGFLGTIDSGGKYIGVGAKSDNYEYLFQEVQCYLKNDEQRSQIMEMGKDDPITVRGKIKSVGEILGYSLDIDSIG